MRKVLFWLLVLTWTAGCACGWAESEENAVISALEKSGCNAPRQIQIWGDTAACIAEKDGERALCLLEKENGDWQVTVCNPRALMQEWGEPKLLLDSDLEIFWHYQVGKNGVSFSAGREGNGPWTFEGEIAVCPLTDQFTKVYLLFWQEDYGGRVSYLERVEDENENCLFSGDTEYFPAPWLADQMLLSSVELAQFPVLSAVPDGHNNWPGENFYASAAHYFMPDYAYLHGVLRDNEMHFLMQKPGGEKVYVICDTHYTATREPSFIESEPLPEDSVLGVENFTDYLGFGGRMVSVQNFPRHPWCGLDCVAGTEDFLYFGRDCVFAGSDEDLIYVGSHPWSSICERNVWSALPATIEEAVSKMDAAALNIGYAVVNNPNPADRLYLRERPDRDSASLGKYYNGTPVKVYQIRGNWAQVEIGRQAGWMMKKYLTFGTSEQGLLCDTSAMPQLMSRGVGLTVYEWPTGWPQVYKRMLTVPVMKIIGVVGEEWYHVWFPQTGDDGFVKQLDLWDGNG